VLPGGIKRLRWHRHTGLENTVNCPARAALRVLDRAPADPDGFLAAFQGRAPRSERELLRHARAGGSGSASRFRGTLMHAIYIRQPRRVGSRPVGTLRGAAAGTSRTSIPHLAT